MRWVLPQWHFKLLKKCTRSVIEGALIVVNATERAGEWRMAYIQYFKLVINNTARQHAPTEADTQHHFNGVQMVGHHGDIKRLVLAVKQILN